jgi:hypothetical protein
MRLKAAVWSLRCQAVGHTDREEPFITAFAEHNILLAICLSPGHESSERKVEETAFFRCFHNKKDHRRHPIIDSPPVTDDTLFLLSNLIESEM